MGYEQIAAVDLGSNSFRLQIGRVVGDQIYPLDTLKEPVRLASGLTSEKQLDAVTQQRALETLSRFAERLRGFQADAVRVVATNTLRVAKNAKFFIPLAEATLGFPIEIIGGREEAGLAASAKTPARTSRRLTGRSQPATGARPAECPPQARPDQRGRHACMQCAPRRRLCMFPALHRRPSLSQRGLIGPRRCG